MLLIKMFLIKCFFGFFLVLFMVFLVGCVFSLGKEGIGEYVDDVVIIIKVKVVIFNELNLKFVEINVEIYKGVVQLFGFVFSFIFVVCVIELVCGVKGVVLVCNDLCLK